jgi:AcrR family transcriptional regulator
MARRKEEAQGEGETGQLSRERIVDASLGLLEQEGWEALSMRRLAQQLDVWPMAVYRYFRDKDELVDALVDHAVEQTELPPARDDWRDQLVALLEAARATLERLPPELRSRLASVLFSPDASGLAATGVELLRSAGFDPEGSRLGWSTLAAYTVGFVEIGPTEAELEYGLDRLLNGLEAELGAAAEAG